jgi:hypothetical protein
MRGRQHQDGIIRHHFSFSFSNMAIRHRGAKAAQSEAVRIFFDEESAPDDDDYVAAPVRREVSIVTSWPFDTLTSFIRVRSNLNGRAQVWEIGQHGLHTKRACGRPESSPM